MRLSCPILLLAALALTGCGDKPAPPPAPGPRVLIISIDGLRPDVALRAEMPHLRALMARGAFTFWARTTELSITLPSHVSMLTGAVPDRHEIFWNYDIPESQTFKPPVPSLLDLAHQRGLTTAMAVGKSKLKEIPCEGALDWHYIPDDLAGDLVVARASAVIITAHRPQVMFVHLAEPDSTGHRSGWGSASQLETVRTSDQALGMLLVALRQAGVLDQTTIILTADHGGQSTTHGADDPRSRFIPWIVAGPNVRTNFDLTAERDLVINTEDTFATACWVLGLPLPEDCDGRPVTWAFTDPPSPRRSLLRDAAE